MEHETSDLSKQTSIRFRCRKILPDEGKKTNSGPSVAEIVKIDEKENSGSVFLSQTPEKPEFRSKRKETSCIMGIERKSSDNFHGDNVTLAPAVDHAVSEFSEGCSSAVKSSENEPVEIPEKFKMLANLFDRMECSIRLLNLCKRVPTFQNISTQVEILTKRKFLYNQLAQMKYVLPEAIQIEKLLVHDVSSLCMNPDLKVTLKFDCVERSLHPHQSASMTLCQAFRSRLLDFFIAQPKVVDIPEAVLPDPFNQVNDPAPMEKMIEKSAALLPQQSLVSLNSLSSVSHLPPSFHKQFSCQETILAEQKTQLLATTDSMVFVDLDDEDTNCIKSPMKKVDISPLSTIKPLRQEIHSPKSLIGSNVAKSTPAKFIISSDELATVTPALQTPKKALPTPHEKLATVEGHLVTEAKGTSSVRRSLIYAPEETDGSPSDLLSPTEQNRSAKVLCDQTKTDKRSNSGEEFSGSPTTQVHATTVCDRAVGASVTEDHKLAQEAHGKQEEMLACLPDMFNTIRFIFRTTNLGLITKKELVHKIISINLEIEDTSEVEVQLELLEQLLPDWICKKTDPSGDFLYRIKKTIDPELVRARLLEAAEA